MASSVGNIETGGGKTDMVPHWKIIPGNLRFFLDGRIRTVKSWYYVPLSLGITLVTGGIHFPIDGPFLAEKVSIAIPIVGFTVYVLTIIHFLACFFIDPGYLPRASAYEAFVIEKENNILTDLSGAYYPPPRNKMVKVNGFDYEMRFCTTCKFYRPVRTVHCKHCNMCVDRFDHHCPWVGNCIGKRNHRYFFLFLVFAYSTAAYGCFSSIATTVMKSLLPNRPADISASIIVMTVAFLSLLFLSKLTVCHWVFVCNDKTTNEKIKKKYKSNAHNPFRGHPFKNFARLVCFSQSPPYIDYRKKLPIDYYQEYDKNLEILRSTNNFPGSFYSSKLLIPIPGDVLYREIIRRNDNQALNFNEEVQVLNSKIEAKVSYDMLVNDDDKRYIQTRQFLNNEFVDYCFRGFAGAKNYLILKSFENKSFYWTFIHDFKISNIVLFEDKSDEEKFLNNYSFIYDPETINTISHLTNLNIQFMSSKSFTNFSVSKFRTSWKTYQKDAKNPSPNEVKVYRFWAFDAKETFLPSESPYYLKFIRLINRNNPSTPKNSPTVYSNYLFHAQKFERIFGFIVMDHVCDELILKQRFSPVNAINLLSREQNNINKTKFMLSQHLFLYISSLIAWQMSSDLDVDQVDGYIQTLLKYSYKSKEKSPIQTQFDNLRQTVFADFSLRKNLPMLRKDADYPDFFQFSLYDTHDLTLVVGKSGYNDELIEYITRNNIDLLISINLSHHDFKKSLKRTSFFSFMETALPNTLETGGDQVVMKKQKINFKLDISKLYDVPQDPKTPPKFSYLMECDFTQVIIDQFDLKPAISFLNGERSYSFGMVELLCSILMNILANKNEFYKRCVILCNDPKLAALFTIAYVNLRQAQVERTMNINMAAHMVLTKLAYYVCANTNYDTAILDHESVFNKVFDLEEYKLVCETSALISQDLLQSNEQ